jgi:hypothetical protein
MTGQWVSSMAAFAWIIVMFEQQLCYRVPGPAQHEAIVPVEVFVVETYVDGFNHLTQLIAQRKLHHIMLPVPLYGSETWSLTLWQNIC